MNNFPSAAISIKPTRSTRSLSRTQHLRHSSAPMTTSMLNPPHSPDFDADLLSHAVKAWREEWRSENDFCGDLSKLAGSGSYLKRWQKRWFVLQASSLFYFKRYDDTAPIGVLFLDKNTKIMPSPEGWANGTFSFSVSVSSACSLDSEKVHKNRVFQLCAESQHDFDGWMAALKPFYSINTASLGRRMSVITSPVDSLHVREEKFGSFTSSSSATFDNRSVRRYNLSTSSSSDYSRDTRVNSEPVSVSSSSPAGKFEQISQRKVAHALYSIFLEVYNQVQAYRDFAQNVVSDHQLDVEGQIIPVNFLQPATEMIRSVRHLLYFTDSKFTTAMHNTDFTACLGRQMSVIIDRLRTIGLHAKYMTEEECIGYRNLEAIREIIEHTEEMQMEMHSFVALTKSISEVDSLLSRKDAFITYCPTKPTIRMMLITLFDLGRKIAQNINSQQHSVVLDCCIELGKMTVPIAHLIKSLHGKLEQNTLTMVPDTLLQFAMTSKEQEDAHQFLNDESLLLTDALALATTNVSNSTMISLTEKFFALYLNSLRVLLTVVMLMPLRDSGVDEIVQSLSTLAITEPLLTIVTNFDERINQAPDDSLVAMNNTATPRAHSSTFQEFSTDKNVNVSVVKSAQRLIQTLSTSAENLKITCAQEDLNLDLVTHLAMSIISSANQIEEEVGSLETVPESEETMDRIDDEQQDLSRCMSKFEFSIRQLTGVHSVNNSVALVYKAADDLLVKSATLTEVLEMLVKVEIPRELPCPPSAPISPPKQLASFLEPHSVDVCLLKMNLSNFQDDELAVNKALEDEDKIANSADISFRTVDDKTTIRAGTIEKLVEFLTHYKAPSTDYTNAFLLTYRSFTSPEYLLQLLMTRYTLMAPVFLNDAQKALYIKRKVIPVRLRVFNFLKMWIKNGHEDFDADSGLLDKLRRSLPMIQVDFRSGVRDLEKLLSKRKQSNLQTTPAVDPLSAVLSSSVQASTTFCSFDALEVARQITLLQWELFGSISASEFMNQSWNRQQYHHRSPNIRRMIKFSNFLVQWVCTEIVSVDNLKQRAQTIRHFLAVAEKLKLLNNFDGLKALVCGLQMSAVRRLTKSWDMIPSRPRNAFKETSALMSEEKASKAYRAYLHSIDPPCIPFLGVYLTDLTLIDTGNPDRIARDAVSGSSLSEKPELVNFHKHFLEAQVIQEIRRYQHTKYSFTRNDSIIDWIRSRPAKDGQETYEMSLRVEARVPTPPSPA